MINFFRSESKSSVNTQDNSTMDLSDSCIASSRLKTQEIHKLTPTVSELSRDDFSDLFTTTEDQIDRQMATYVMALGYKQKQFINEALEQACSDTIGWVNSELRESFEQKTIESIDSLAMDKFSKERDDAAMLAFDVRNARTRFKFGKSHYETAYKELAERYVLTFARPIEFPAEISVNSSKGHFKFTLNTSDLTQNVDREDSTLRGLAFLAPQLNGSNELSISKIFLIMHRL